MPCLHISDVEEVGLVTSDRLGRANSSPYDSVHSEAVAR